MIDKVMIDGQQVELTKDMFEMAPANFGDNEAISRPSLTFWQDARVILCCIILMAIFAPMFSKFDYKTQNIRHTKVPPKMPIVSSLGIMDGKNSDGVDVYEEKGIEETYLFGTDALGRDIWTRTWTGARVSLFIALLYTFGSLFSLITSLGFIISPLLESAE